MRDEGGGDACDVVEAGWFGGLDDGVEAVQDIRDNLGGEEAAVFCGRIAVG